MKFSILNIELAYLKVPHTANTRQVEDIRHEHTRRVWALSRHVRPLKLQSDNTRSHDDTVQLLHCHTMAMTRSSCCTHLVLRHSRMTQQNRKIKKSFQWHSSHWWCAIGTHFGLVYKYDVRSPLNMVLFEVLLLAYTLTKSLSAMPCHEINGVGWTCGTQREGSGTTASGRSLILK